MPAFFYGMTFYDLLWYFILYAVIGWCCEVVFCSVNTGKFVNRGFLNGPYCPIYGFGAVIIVGLLEPVQSLLLLYIVSALLCSLLELVGGFLLKKIFHTSWWDYSDEPFNLGGYICLKFSLLWGVAGVLLMRVLHPLVAGLVSLIPYMLGIILLIIVYLFLVADLTVTVVAIGKWNKDLKEIARLQSSLRKGSEAMAEGIGNTAITVAEKIESIPWEEKKQQLTQGLDEQREKLAASLQKSKEKIADITADRPGSLSERWNDSQTKQRFTALLQRITPVRKRLLRAFPQMKNTRYPEAFSRWRGRHGTEGSGDSDGVPNGSESAENKAAD